MELIKCLLRMFNVFHHATRHDYVDTRVRKDRTSEIRLNEFNAFDIRCKIDHVEPYQSVRFTSESGQHRSCSSTSRIKQRVVRGEICLDLSLENSIRMLIGREESFFQGASTFVHDFSI